MATAGRIAWQPTVQTSEAPSRLINVVFLQGGEADHALDLIEVRGRGCRDPETRRPRLRRRDRRCCAREWVRLRQGARRTARPCDDARCVHPGLQPSSPGTLPFTGPKTACPTPCCSASQNPRHARTDRHPRARRCCCGFASGAAGTSGHPDDQPTKLREPANAAGPRTMSHEPGEAEPGRLHTSVLVGPEGELRKHRRARARSRRGPPPNRSKSRRHRRSPSPSGRGTRSSPRDPLSAAGRRRRTGSVAHTGPVPAPAPPGHLCNAVGALPVSRGRQAQLQPEPSSDKTSPRAALSVYDPWQLYKQGVITAPNILLAGIVGSEESSLAEGLYTRALPVRASPLHPGRPERRAYFRRPGRRRPCHRARPIALPTRLNPLDEGYGARGIPDEDWAAQVAARRRDRIGALAETVLDRRLTPVEHTAIDVALADAVRCAEVPILPMVVGRILAPAKADDPDGELAEDGRMVGGTHSAGSSSATSRACSTFPVPKSSIPPSRCSRSISPEWPRTPPCSRC